MSCAETGEKDHIGLEFTKLNNNKGYRERERLRV